jgi:hypothetical protein
VRYLLVNKTVENLGSIACSVGLSCLDDLLDFCFNEHFLQNWSSNPVSVDEDVGWKVPFVLCLVLLERVHQKLRQDLGSLLSDLFSLVLFGMLSPLFVKRTIDCLGIVLSDVFIVRGNKANYLSCSHLAVVNSNNHCVFEDRREFDSVEILTHLCVQLLQNVA